MKIPSSVLLLLSACVTFAADAVVDKPIMLPRVVVNGSPNTKFFTISAEAKLPLPFSKIKSARFTRIFAAGEKSGIKVGDELLSINGVSVGTMTAAGFGMKMIRKRAPGTREEFVIRTPKGEIRTVIFVCEELSEKPNSAPEPTPTAVTPPAAQEPRQP